MFDKFRKKHIASIASDNSIEKAKSENNPEVTFKPFDKNKKIEMTMHCCWTLSPDQFEQLTGGRTKLTFLQWYTAVWWIQHDPTITKAELARVVGTTWPTADIMMDRIKELVPGYRYMLEIKDTKKQEKS